MIYFFASWVVKIDVSHLIMIRWLRVTFITRSIEDLTVLPSPSIVRVNVESTFTAITFWIFLNVHCEQIQNKGSEFLFALLLYGTNWRVCHSWWRWTCTSLKPELVLCVVPISHLWNDLSALFTASSCSVQCLHYHLLFFFFNPHWSFHVFCACSYLFDLFITPLPLLAIILLLVSNLLFDLSLSDLSVSTFAPSCPNIFL